MSLLMIHKAYMPVYSDPDFSCGTDGTDGTGRTDQPKVVQEVLADLKILASQMIATVIVRTTALRFIRMNIDVFR